MYANSDVLEQIETDENAWILEFLNDLDLDVPVSDVKVSLQDSKITITVPVGKVFGIEENVSSSKVIPALEQKGYVCS